MLKPVILCVDDEKTVLDALVFLLEPKLSADFDIEIAQNADEALEFIDQLIERGQELAVVITDQLMPRMRGDEFLIKIHNIFPETLKILLTGFAEQDAIQNCINKARLYRYLRKPWDNNDLLLTVEEAARSYKQYLQLLEYNLYNRLLRNLNNAMQDITAEVDVERLSRRFIRIVVNNTGAERGFLLLNDNPGQYIAAFACLEDAEEQALKKMFEQDPSALFQYIVKNMKEVLPRMLSEDNRMSMPINYKGRNFGYVYAENTVSLKNFNNNQRQVFHILSDQLAVSLANASLYSNVMQKTEELMKEKDNAQQINILLERRNRSITDSIQYARKIQDAIMPAQETRQRCLPHSFVLYLPKDIVSGDFYWWVEMEDSFLIAAVDCTGHGVPGAFMSVIAANAFNQIVKERNITQPGDILYHLNLLVRKALKQDEQEVSWDDGMVVALCKIDKNGKKIHFAGAKRPLWYVRDGAINEINGSKHAIGGQITDSTNIAFEQHTLTTQKGDMFYLQSDGYSDQFGGSPRRKFTTKRLKLKLLTIADLPIEQQQQDLLQTFQDWKKNESQIDDVLVIGFHV